MKQEKEKKCLFCSEIKDIIFKNNNFYSIYDKNPVSNGHELVISKRHFSSLAEIKEEEILDFHDALNNVIKLIKNKFNPDGFNIGINDGKTAGQTILHLHVHIIPRYKGDVENPIGGVRNIFPGKGDYTK